MDVVAGPLLADSAAGEQQRVVERFLAAMTSGDVPGLLKVLAPDVVIMGGIAARIDPGGENGTAVSFVIEDGRITRIYAIRNPHKFTRLGEATELRR
ncbi:hypothetical protein [Virgisporangium ochraceum]|uniref:hypothetical protein n=1 Tax=Virgisporangium ochraceum TaxID=65505 RepID=UPI001940EDE2|nr:hypothetical protein [Virgisporangium ochraceum]